MAPKRKFYAVARGRKAGIYDTWEECELQTKGYSGATFKSFRTQEQAEAFMEPVKQVASLSTDKPTEAAANTRSAPVTPSTTPTQPSQCPARIAQKGSRSIKNPYSNTKKLCALSPMAEGYGFMPLPSASSFALATPTATTTTTPTSSSAIKNPYSKTRKAYASPPMAERYGNIPLPCASSFALSTPTATAATSPTSSSAIKNPYSETKNGFTSPPPILNKRPRPTIPSSITPTVLARSDNPVEMTGTSKHHLHHFETEAIGID